MQIKTKLKLNILWLLLFVDILVPPNYNNTYRTLEEENNLN